MCKCICPNCHQELDDDDYEEYTVYHNQIEGHCNKCGYETHWGYFFRD